MKQNEQQNKHPGTGYMLCVIGGFLTGLIYSAKSGDFTGAGLIMHAVIRGVAGAVFHHSLN